MRHSIRILRHHTQAAITSFLVSFLLIALITLLSGCGRDGAAVNTVVGTWAFNSSTLQETLVLNADHTYSDTETGSDAHVPATTTGTYSMPDSSTLIVNGGISGPETNKVSFTDYNHMTLDPGKGNAETYTRQQ